MSKARKISNHEQLTVPSDSYLLLSKH